MEIVITLSVPFCWALSKTVLLTPAAETATKIQRKLWMFATIRWVTRVLKPICSNKPLNKSTGTVHRPLLLRFFPTNCIFSSWHIVVGINTHRRWWLLIKWNLLLLMLLRLLRRLQKVSWCSQASNLFGDETLHTFLHQLQLWLRLHCPCTANWHTL